MYDISRLKKDNRMHTAAYKITNLGVVISPYSSDKEIPLNINPGLTALSSATVEQETLKELLVKTLPGLPVNQFGAIAKDLASAVKNAFAELNETNTNEDLVLGEVTSSKDKMSTIDSNQIILCIKEAIRKEFAPGGPYIRY